MESKYKTSLAHSNNVRWPLREIHLFRPFWVFSILSHATRRPSVQILLVIKYVSRNYRFIVINFHLWYLDINHNLLSLWYEGQNSKEPVDLIFFPMRRSHPLQESLANTTLSTTYNLVHNCFYFYCFLLLLFFFTYYKSGVRNKSNN